MIDRNSATTLTTTSEREAVITHVFNAPRALVFDAMTKPEHVRRWYGLRGSTMPVCEIDLRVGGRWRYVTRGSDGNDYGFSGEYLEIAAPERLVFTEVFEPMPDSGYVVDATYEERDGKTYLTALLRYQSQEHRDGHLNSGMEGGMRDTYARLDELLAELQSAAGSAESITITRIFDAPREIVWQAWTQPEHVSRWWGPKDFTSPNNTIDLRVGGKYLFVMRSPEGENLYTTGVYKEIVPNEKLVYTDSFADAQGNVIAGSELGMEGFPLALDVTVLFEDTGDGRTRMTVTQTGVPAGEAREMTIHGWNESFDKLAGTL